MKDNVLLGFCFCDEHIAQRRQKRERTFVEWTLLALGVVFFALGLAAFAVVLGVY